MVWRSAPSSPGRRSEEHTSELQSHSDLVCRLLLEKKKICRRIDALGHAVVAGDLGDAQAIIVEHALASFFFHHAATTEIYTLSLHDALPISPGSRSRRTSTSRPRNLLPCISACSSPAATAAAGSSVFCGSQVPMSQTMTSPPPYSPAGMTPSKSRYSMGWSSTCTALRRAAGSSVGPRGTAQLASTPFISNRRS